MCVNTVDVQNAQYQIGDKQMACTNEKCHNAECICDPCKCTEEDQCPCCVDN